MHIKKPKYLRIASDLHLDFDVPQFFKRFAKLWKPAPLETDEETVFVIAGDIWHAKKPFDFFGKSWISSLSKQFQYVVLVLGNHDFWGGDISQEYQYYQKMISRHHLSNVFLLQNSSLILPGLKIIGATLWTDYMQSNYVCMNNAQLSGMKDYQYIKDGQSLITPKKLLQEHILSRNYIFENAKPDYAEQKKIVVTHHSPSYRSIPERSRNDDAQIEKSLYHSDLDDQIITSGFNMWIHGHSHHAVDYFIARTRIISNPRGYPLEDTGYNPWLVFNIDEI